MDVASDRQFSRSFLPVPRKKGDGGLSKPPTASVLHAVIQKVVTPAVVEDIVQRIVEEAKQGTATEKREARRLLFQYLGGVGQRSAQPTTKYVQQNFYGGEKRQSRRAMRALIVRYLESEDSPQGVEVIASSVALPRREVERELNGHPELFVQKPNGRGLAWGLRKSS